MSKFFLPSCCLVLIMAACQQDGSPAADATATGLPEASPTLSGSQLAASQAMEETDYIGRSRRSLEKIQRLYDQAAGKMPGLGKVSTRIDDDFTLTIQNELPDGTVRTVVNLKHINPSDGSIMLIPDTQPGEFPGIRLQVLEGRPGVSIYQNDQLSAETMFLELYMPTRSDIEQMAPVLVSILNIVHGKTQ
ncbi:MAG: hypothetical protein RLY31_522 [Bacteroidota bacterium]|jgi:hypothetical protein